MHPNTKARFFVRQGPSLFGGPAERYREEWLTSSEAGRLGALPATATILQGLVREGLERTEQPDFLGHLLEASRGEREFDEASVVRSLHEFESAKEHARQQAEEYFEAVERFVRSGTTTGNQPHVAAFAAWWQRSDLKCVESRVTAAAADFAGRVDLVAEHPEYGRCLVDVGTQETARGRFSFYVGMGMDLGARALAVEESTGLRPRIISTLASRNAPGLFHAKTWTPREQSRLSAAFLAQKTIWYNETGYPLRKAGAEASSAGPRPDAA